MMRLSAALLFFMLSPIAGSAAPDLSQFAYQQRPGNQLPLDAGFLDEARRSVRFGDLLNGHPAILALGYFHCPNLCGVVRADLMDALSHSGLEPTRDYTLIVLSIDPTETSKDAARAKQDDAVLTSLRHAPDGWHYLTGTAEQIAQIERGVGFRSRFDPELKQFLHPSGIVFLTASGKVSSYLLGVGYKPGDVRLGVTRASQGIAKAALPVLLLCFHYDPTTGRYTLAVTRILQLACALTVLTVGGTIVLALRRERRQ